ncbi:hypothetical protein DACRYDRAFT_119763 [Dacryopinax primogenitus]|uniref:DUF336-domain-containing protein n=1 Tax=Dacryopinax primogenitus (strain DJM 731) TaxID=1858805 RepID=M5FN74_DACPD|nr:uncharacterized protein DACRYDRAFT_119763 [Dacryopinax primogenitus]EJT96950.1 hypothetical protein DACRYDRAFT_119763 [Dacryopinax primogenitus]
MSEQTIYTEQPGRPRLSPSIYLEKLASYLKEEREHRFPYFTAAVAFDLGLALRAKHISLSASSALRNPIVISISTFSGAVLFQCVAGGDPPDAADLATWAAAKTNTVRRFGHSSAFIECRMLATGKGPEEAGLSWPQYAVVGGGFPVYLRNAPAAPFGAIAIAGLTHDDDHRLIVQTLAEFIPNLTPPYARQDSSASAAGQPPSEESSKRLQRDGSPARTAEHPILMNNWSENEDVADQSEEADDSQSSGEDGEGTGADRGGRAPWR